MDRERVVRTATPWLILTIVTLPYVRVGCLAPHAQPRHRGCYQQPHPAQTRILISEITPNHQQGAIPRP